MSPIFAFSTSLILAVIYPTDPTESLSTEYISAELSSEGVDLQLEGDLKKCYEQVKTGMKWVIRLKEIGSKVATGEVGKAFDIINEGIKDLIVAKKMYVYLIDDLTGEPVQAPGWPIEITKPSEIVHKLVPIMHIGVRAVSIFNGVAGVARMCGFPSPKVPKEWSKGLQESVELLKKESSVEDFGVVHDEVKGIALARGLRSASVRGLQHAGQQPRHLAC